jgi:hypothetical protein
MNEKPRKRWVHPEEYRALRHQRIRHCATGFGIALFGLVVIALEFVFNGGSMKNPPAPEPPAAVHFGIAETALLILCVPFVILAAWAEYGPLLSAIYQSFKDAWNVESVRVVTPRNHHIAPAAHSLVRASDLPPSQPQAELLRAAKTGSGTPAPELLRAADAQLPQDAEHVSRTTGKWR